MARSALGKDFLREIRRTRSRFCSILLLVALSVAFLSGLRATAPDMKHTGDDYLDGLHLADVQVLSVLGLTDGDLEALLAREEFSDGEGVYVLDAFASSQTAEAVTKIHSLSARGISDVQLRAGRMPQADDECVVEDALLEILNISLGDTLTLRPGGQLTDALRHTAFTVVGTVRSPVYISIERGSSTLGSGTVRAYIYLPQASFDLDFYTAIYLRVQGAEELTAFTEAYDSRIEDVISALGPFAQTRAQLRYDAIVDDARRKVSDAQHELDDARAEAARRLSDAEQELAEARAELDDGWADYHAGARTLEEETLRAERRLEDGAADLQQALRQLEEGQAEYDRGLAQYEDGLAELAAGRAAYDAGVLQYEQGLAQLESGKQRLTESRQTLADAEMQLAGAQAELDRAQTVLDVMAGLLFGTDSQSLYDGLEDGSIDASEVDERLQKTGELLDEAIARGQELLDSLPDGQRLQELLDALPDEIRQIPELQEMIAALPDRARLQELLEEAAARRSELGELGVDQFRAAMRQLSEGRAQLEQGRAELEAGRQQLADGERELEAASGELDNARRALLLAQEELVSGQAELDSARAELDDAAQRLSDGRADYAAGQQTLQDARQELAVRTAEARQELAEAEAELTDGEAQYADGVRAYEQAEQDAEQQLADGERELLDARRRISEIEHGEWYVLSRSYNPGYTGFGQDADRMGNLAHVFPMIFFLVAALVCLTTMTRMVEEQRVQIGSMKAMGYGRLAISFKYLGYGLLPGLLGSVAGLAVGYTLFPSMIFTAYQIMYQMPSIELRSYAGISAFSVAAAVACTTLSTLWACLATLRETPASLMRPRTPKAGKRVLLEYIRPLWRRMKFIHKVTARNLFRYQKRFWMTVIGIGGCTALIIAGFGLRSSLMFTMSRQFDELFHYTAQVVLPDSILPEDRAAIEAFLAADARVTGTGACYLTSASAVGARNTSGVYLEAMDAEVLADAVELLDCRTGRTIAMEDGGVYIDQKLSELLDVRVGDTILLDAGTRAEAAVAGIFENYAAHFVYMTPACFTQLFGRAFEPNAFLLTLQQEDAPFCDAFFEDLMRLGSVSASRLSATRDTYLHSMERIDFVVVIVILAAAALAMVVLYNLSNINITERMRELATIKLLGFYDREVSAYVYRENIVLTLLGIALGIGLGHALHVWLVRSVEIDLMMFGRQTDPRSYLYAAVLTSLFSLLVNLIAHFRMKKIDMVESLKSAE